MSRTHLFEFHERQECPAFLRESIVETLGRGLHWGGLTEVIGPSFEAFCVQARPKTVLDLCSGSGRPAIDLVSWLRARGTVPPRMVLSDLFPDNLASEESSALQSEGIAVCSHPVDATAVSDTDHDARLIVNAFHHFDTPQARAILEDCAARGKSIYIFEGMRRGLLPLLRLGLSMPTVPIALLANPFLTSKKALLKAFFTFVIPLVPLAFLWDSVISSLRWYDKHELAALTESIEGYRWTYREIPFGRGATAVAFYGVPEAIAAANEADSHEA